MKMHEIAMLPQPISIARTGAAAGGSDGAGLGLTQRAHDHDHEAPREAVVDISWQTRGHLAADSKGAQVAVAASTTPQVYAFGINLSWLPRWLQLVACCCGIFFGFVINAICEEFLFKTLEFRHVPICQEKGDPVLKIFNMYPWYFTFSQFAIYIVLAYIHGFRPSQITHPWGAYFKLGAVLVGSMGLTKCSLQYINYAAQIIFKSCKVIPVMAVSHLFPGLRRSYKAHEYRQAILLVIGLIIFTLADAQVTPTFALAGVILIIGALIFDAFLGNLQELLFTVGPSTSQEEVVFCSSAAGLLFLIPPMVITGELSSSPSILNLEPKVYIVICVAALASYIGQLAVLSSVALFGAATTYVVTSLRKAFTLFISYLIFTKPFSLMHLVGVSLIFLSFALKCTAKKKSKDGYQELAMTSSADESIDVKEARLQEKIEAASR
eukprot:SM000025S08455  [mRNA]  locus=s25:796602:799229:- [translate_table: standard]